MWPIVELGKRTLGVQKKENLKNDKAKNVNGDREDKKRTLVETYVQI